MRTYVQLAAATLLGLFLPAACVAQGVSDATLESFLGLAAGDLDALSGATVAPGDVTTGSAMKLEFTAQAGDQLSADWNFLTDEFLGELDFNDFSFISITVDGVLEVLADTHAGFSPSSFYLEETGFNTFGHTFANAGDVVLGFGVVNVGDSFVSSALLVDNVTLNDAPGAPIFSEGFEGGLFGAFDTIGLASNVDTGFSIDPGTGSFMVLLESGFVPEPSTWVLAVLLAAGVVSRRERA